MKEVKKKPKIAVLWFYLIKVGRRGMFVKLLKFVILLYSHGVELPLFR